MNSTLLPLVRRMNLVVCLGSALLLKALLTSEASAQAFPVWNGSNSSWSNTGNWTGGNASSYGQLQFTGGGVTTTNNDIGTVSQWRMYFSGSSSYTLTTGGGAVNLFDFSGAHSWVLNDSSVTQTFSGLAVNFAATAGATFGQISSRGAGNLVLSNVGITGSQVSSLRIVSESAGNVTVNGVISGTGKSVTVGLKQDNTTDADSNVIFNGANTYTGDTFVVAGSLSFGSGGSSNSSIVRLGDITGTNAATVKLTSSTGGQNLSSTLVARPGSSGLLTLSSENTSGTNTWSGGIFLDKSLTINQSAGGTLAITGGLDVKANIATFGGSGNFDVSSVISNSIGSGRVTMSGSGLLRFGSANTYSNETNIDAGTIRVDAAPTGTGLLSTYYVGNGGATGTSATLLLGGGAAGTSGGLTFGNAVTANAGSSGNRVIGGSNTTGTNTFGGTITLTDGNATLRAATGGTVAFNTITAATAQTARIGGSGNDGTVQLGGVSDNVNFGATVNSGTLLLAKASSATVHAIGAGLTVNNGATARLAGTGGDQIFDSTFVTVASGGTFDLNGRSETLGALSLAGTGSGSNGALVASSGSSTLTPSSTTLTAATSIGVTNGADTLTLNNAINGSGSLTKVGDGILSVNGSSSYSGGTTVSAGTLNVTNSTGSATGSGNVTVSNTAVLSGTGKINANTNLIMINGALVVGDETQGSATASTFELGTSGIGSTTLGAGSSLMLDLFTNAGNNQSIASAADMIRLFGGVTIDLLSGLQLNNAGGISSFADGDSWKIGDLTGATVSGSYGTGQIGGISLGSGLQWQTSIVGSSLILSVTSTAPIPEPGRAALFLLGLGALVMRRRRA